MRKQNHEEIIKRFNYAFAFQIYTTGFIVIIPLLPDAAVK
jgi:hypothetical protein